MSAAKVPRELVLVRGGGELASAAARLLFLAGHPVLVAEREQPLAVRRLVCFAEAVRNGRVSVEGVAARRVNGDALRALLQAREAVAVAVDPEGALIRELRPTVVVDGRMAKRNLGTTRDDAALVVGLGPGLVAGSDVHAVVETQRGPDLGRVIWSGAAEADSGIPAPVAGETEERVLRAPCDGVFQGRASIGALVAAGSVVGAVAGRPVAAGVAGLLRGLVADGVPLAAGTKLGDVDPRGARVDPARLSDKARAVAAGVLEAVSLGLARGRPAVRVEAAR